MERASFCAGWEFSRNGAPFEAVIVPHDAMLGERRGEDAPAGSASGYYFGGVYRYRKMFVLDAALAEDALYFEFEGVYRDAQVTINGHEAAVPPYGFTPFLVELTGLVHEGENLIEVVADNAAQPDCRWYSGAGIYRPVWLWKRAADAAGKGALLGPDSVRVNTVSYDPAVIRVDVDYDNAELSIEIRDGDEVVACAAGTPAEITIPNALLWSAEHPHLYQCVVEARTPEGVADSWQASFGIRLLEWNRTGLLVNGKQTLLRGGCIHCDNGVLGAATFSESELRRIRTLKKAGFNAVRVAHNPAPSTLLDACDELGMYVMNETWDMWYTPKSVYDYARHFLDWCDYDLRRLVAKSYNHPSVIMYSIGNEVADPIEKQGVQLEQSLVDLLHALDSTRPVTCGFNLTMMVMERAGRGWYGQASGVADATGEPGAARGSLLFNMTAQAIGTGMTMISTVPGTDRLVSPALDALDIAGYNYGTARYAVDVRAHADRIIVGSETFPYELPRTWKLVERHPALIGDFMWTAWDYLGEAGAGSWAYTAAEAGFSKPWPWLLAGSGAFDILGQPNAHAALAAAVWRTAEAPSIQVRPVNRMEGKTYKATWRGSDAVPSWSWAGCEGIVTQVEVYDGRAASVRLELNGQELATKRLRDCVARFIVEYRQGTLAAVALDAEGRELAQSSLSSAHAPFHLSVKPEAKQVRAGGIAYAPVIIVGANGVVESNADEQLTATIEGGTLLGFGSAQPAPTESYLTGRYTTYRGHALAVVYRETPGDAILTVTGSTLGSASARITFV